MIALEAALMTGPLSWALAFAPVAYVAAVILCREIRAHRAVGRF